MSRDSLTLAQLPDEDIFTGWARMEARQQGFEIETDVFCDDHGSHIALEMALDGTQYGAFFPYTESDSFEHTLLVVEDVVDEFNTLIKGGDVDDLEHVHTQGLVFDGWTPTYETEDGGLYGIPNDLLEDNE